MQPMVAWLTTQSYTLIREIKLNQWKGTRPYDKTNKIYLATRNNYLNFHVQRAGDKWMIGKLNYVSLI
jgi:hypothetical protein